MAALWRLWDGPARWLWWTLLTLLIVDFWIRDTVKNVAKGTESDYMTPAEAAAWLRKVTIGHMGLTVVTAALAVYAHVIA